MKRSACCSAAILACLGLLFPLTSRAERAAPRTKISIPLTFEENEGQVDANYRFVSRHQGVEGLFSPMGPDFIVPSRTTGGRRVQMRFVHAAPSFKLDGVAPLPGRANYLRGNDREKWKTGIPTFGEIRYLGLYPGIDLSFHGQYDKAQLEHDFVLAPGADPRQISFGFGNSEGLQINANGQLLIGAGDHQLVFDPPQAWQETASGRIPVTATFVKRGPHAVGFEIGKYDRSQTLVIDPVLSFATYLDGTGGDTITDVATDASGDVYVTGRTSSTDFPVSSAKQAALASAPDAFVAKLDPTLHTLLFSTYLGGTNTDQAESIAVDASGNVAISGISSSSDFPAAGKLSSTINTYTTNYNFLASLTADGSTLRYSGYIGSTQGGYDDFNPRQNRVAFDPNGNVYMAGLTQDPNYPYTTGAYGGVPAPYPADESLFVLKAASDGTILYAATIPETPGQQNPGSGHRIDLGGFAVNANGEAVVGGTAGTYLPVTNGVLQTTFPNAATGTAGYVLKLNAAGSDLVFSTYLPGTDAVEGLALDGAGDIYASGMTMETNLPTQSNAFQPTFGNIVTCDCWDGFILKLNNNGTQAPSATYYNGVTTTPSIGYSAPSTFLRDIRVDSVGNVAVAGLTGAANLALKNPLVSVYSSLGLGFINSSLMMARFSGDLSTLQFGSFLSTTDSSAGYDAMTLDPQDRMIVAGGILSTLFPTTPGVVQPVPPSHSAYLTLNYQFIADIDLSVPAPSLCFDSTTVAFGTVPVGSAAQASLNLTNCGNAALTLSGVQSSSALFTTTNNCSAVAPGSSCKIQVTYTPTAVGETDGTLTIAGNMAVSPQVVSFTGTGGVPNVFLPTSIGFSDLLVGETGSTGVLGIYNSGGAPFILTSAAVTGDFQITQNTCTAPVAPRGTCQIYLNFSPTAAGTRTGTLILQDNLTPATQTVQLTGNGLTSAPVPTITSIPAIPQIASGVGQVVISGTGFFPNSVVYWNGVAKTTYYGSENVIVAQISAADVAQIGDVSIYVSTPAPGGGTSNTYLAAIYGRMPNLPILHEVYNPVTSLLYATVASGSSANANSLVTINPVTMQITGTLLSGGKPDALAISDDGTMLYVGQDDLQSVSQISLPSGTVNFTVQLPQGSDSFLSSYGVEASALAVVPAKPHTWIAGICYINVSPCGGGAVIYDDSVMRPTFAQASQLTANSFSFVNDPTVVYSTEFNQSPPDISSYSITASGITHTAVTSWGASAGGAALASDGTWLYVANGQVIDPATFAVKFSYPQGGQGIAVDKVNSRIFYGGTNYSGYGLVSLTAVDIASRSTIGSINFQEYGSVIDVQRFGTKGVVINNGNELLFVQTSLANSTVGAPTVAVSPTSISFGAQTQMTKSAAKAVTLKNGSSVPLNIGSITAYSLSDFTASTDFAETNNCPTALSAGASCTISVTFTPTNAGYETGQLTIFDDASTGDQVVPLDGTGVSATGSYSATVTPTTLTFASQQVQSTSSAQTVTLTNTGTGALQIASVSATGDFAETNNCGISLAAGTNCAINVTFTPTAAGSRTGQLTITDNATAGAQTVSLTGAGESPINIAPSAPGGNSATVTAGGTANYTLTLSSGSYAGVVTFACTGVPAYAACTVSPASTSVAAGQNATVKASITTSSASQAMLEQFDRPALAGMGWLLLPAMPLLLLLRRRAARAQLLVLVATALIGIATGCGGGGGSTATPPPATHTTPAGTYQITLTATAGAETSTQQLTLIVQ